MSNDYCWHCGAYLDPEAKYCSACGEPVSEGSVAGEGAVTSPKRGVPADDDAILAAGAHVLAIFTWLVGPVVVLYVADDPFVETNARNATNWQIAYTIYMIVAIVLAAVLIGIPLLLALPLVNVAFCVIAGVKAYQGETWEYPATPRIL